MRRPLWIWIVAMIVLAVFAQFTGAQNVVTLITHDSFNISEDVLATFEAETGLTVEILRSGDTGSLVNQAVLNAGNPVGDVLFGVDNTFLSRALEADLFLAYESPLLEMVDAQFLLDDALVTPIDYGDVCLNYDIAYFDENDLPVPTNLRDLTQPEYEGLLVVQNPATSSPGLAFLMVTIAAFGTPDDADNGYTYLDYWTDLIDNGTFVANDWTNAYFGQFTAGSEDGTYPIVVSYASSPPFTYDETLDDVTTASIVADGTCFRQIEYAGILRGADNVEGAQQLIDFMLSEAFQNDLPLQMFVFPVNTQAELPQLFADYAQIPDNPVTLPFEEIEANRDDWIQAWTETVLR